MTIESASRRVSRGALTVLAYLFASVAIAAVPVHVVKTDLKPGIRAGMQSPVQFAVLVPHKVSTASGGTWSTSGDKAIWSYAVQVPTAVSLSFHAAQSQLPDAATLVVQGAKTTTSYSARDLHRGELWSRIHPGDALQLTLTVPAADRGRVALNIVSLQAGYRSLGAGVADHPYYVQLQSQGTAASGNAACVTNYKCQVTTANAAPAASTVALVIGGLYQCTGTLINDVPGDNTPYVLTARHCETGQVGVGGDPGIAANTSVYWDATTACSSALGSIYDPATATQFGAQTMVEQQDAWLIKLDASPVVDDAQAAGFDASGGAVQGGYTIHHAEGFNKQFVEWFGQAALVPSYLNFPKFLETVNQLGNIGPGASGSGLFDQNNRLVGTLTFGRATGDASGYGSCPAAPPAPPNGSNGAADFTSFSGVWNFNTDSNSMTGTTTIKSILDPGNTGTLVVASVPFINITFTAQFQAQTFGQPVTLTWSAAGASQCTAAGGISGDGWSGTLAASGSQAVTESAPTLATYTLACSYPGNRIARAFVTVNWVGPTPVVQFSASRSLLWTTRPVTLSWSSNTEPCSITGGSLSLANLPASGSTTATEATPADVSYVITCGPANNSVRETAADVIFATPSLVLQANSTDRLSGQPLALAWLSYADQCTPSGGAPNDGWSVSEFYGAQSFSATVTAAGTYTYTLTCSSGPLSVQQSVQVQIENNAPYANLSVDRNTVTLSDSPSDYMTLSWISNLSLCTVSSQPYMPTSPLPTPASLFGAPQPQDSLVLAPTTPGSYVFTVTCTAQLTGNVAATSTPTTLTVLPPPPPTATLTIKPASVAIGQNFTVTWSSANTSQCTSAAGVNASPVWIEGEILPVAGSRTLSFGQPTQATLAIQCQSPDPTQSPASAEASVTVLGPEVTLTANSTNIVRNSDLTLTWSSTNATACTAAGGGADGVAWTGTLPTSGAVTQTATTDGSFTYTINCTNEGAIASAVVTINVSAPAGDAGGGGGGGGAIGILDLALLGVWQLLRRRRTAPATQKYAA